MVKAAACGKVVERPPHTWSKCHVETQIGYLHISICHKCQYVLNWRRVPGLELKKRRFLLINLDVTLLPSPPCTWCHMTLRVWCYNLRTVRFWLQVYNHRGWSATGWQAISANYKWTSGPCLSWTINCPSTEISVLRQGKKYLVSPALWSSIFSSKLFVRTKGKETLSSER